MIKAVQGGDAYEKCVHQVPVIGNQAHRPLILAALVPEVFTHPQNELVCSVEGNSEWRSAVERVLLQVSGQRIPPPVSQCEHGYNQSTGDGHCDSSKTYVSWRRNDAGRKSPFARGRASDGDDSKGEKQHECEKQRAERFL